MKQCKASCKVTAWNSGYTSLLAFVEGCPLLVFVQLHAQHRFEHAGSQYSIWAPIHSSLQSRGLGYWHNCIQPFQHAEEARYARGSRQVTHTAICCMLMHALSLEQESLQASIAVYGKSSLGA